jgi:hypothetical protein
VIARASKSGKSEVVTDPKAQRALVASIVGAMFVLFIAVPAAVSLASGDGAVCFTSSECPLAGINPCVRKPSFALIGRCALAIR